MLQIQIRPAHMTSTLLRRLFKAPNLKTFAEGNADFLDLPAFHDYIRQLCAEAGVAPEQAIRQAGLDRTYGHQLFNGTRRPSRDKVIQLAFGFGLDVDGAQELLKRACKSALYPYILRDAAILRCLNERLSVIEAQAVLHELGLTLLGGDRTHG